MNIIVEVIGSKLHRWIAVSVHGRLCALVNCDGKADKDVYALAANEVKMFGVSTFEARGW